jgi:hypothetical protein
MPRIARPGPAVRACTAVTRSHLPWARVLAESLAEQHPGAPRLTVLVSDDADGAVRAADEPFDVLSPADVAIDRAELHRRGLMYRPMELTGSMRAALLGAMLDRSAGDPVLFLDADVYVVGSLARWPRRRASTGSCCRRTFRARRPSPSRWSVTFCARARTIAATSPCPAATARASPPGGPAISPRLPGRPRGGPVRLAALARPRPEPVRRGHAARPRQQRDAPQRRDAPVVRTAGAWTIDGAPLRFLHVSGGFDPRASQWPWLTRDPGLTSLCRAYADRLVAAGHRADPSPPYAYGATVEGLPIDPWVRRRCRSAILAGEPVPDPFDAATAGDFAAWLAEPVDGSTPPVSRWALALRDFRPDLRAVFFDVPGAHSHEYLVWLADHGPQEVSGRRASA